MATTTKTLLTAEEFVDQYARKGSYELVRGEVVPFPPPNFEHGFICLNFGAIIREYARQSGLGRAAGNDSSVQTTRGPDTVRGAGIAYFSYERFPRTESKAVIPRAAPELTVEVNSPGDRQSEIRKKVTEYLAAGVLMVWVVEPKRRTVSIERPGGSLPIILGEDDIIENLTELPGFRCRVAEFFE